MKNSGLSVPAASLNNGFSTSRPTTAITAMATAASTRAMTTPWATEVVSAALPSAPIRNNSGTTARSWASRMAKLLRPVVDIMRRWPDSTSMTRAVEESARQAPMITAAAGGWPNHRAPKLITTVVSRACSPPSPNTRRRMVSRRRIDSSRPMKNSRKTMPRSAMKAICFSPVTVSQSMARE